MICQLNIMKALEILRKDNKMGQKYVWDVKKILKADRTYMIGLLEDLHR